MNKETFFTNESGVRDWESGEVFPAVFEKCEKNNIAFTVSGEHVIERNSNYVIIDTGNDADL